MSIVLKNSIRLTEKEDYSEIGNSRIGGNPDLPIQMNYPVFENGFYEFILQLNLSENKIIGYPENGMISIFYGNLDNNEAIAYYFNKNQKLENKQTPIGSKFAGVTDFREHNSHKFVVEENTLKHRSKFPEYNNPDFEEEDNINHWKNDFLNEQSFLSQEGLQDKSHVFLKSRGFGKLLYGSGIWINPNSNELNYRGRNANKEYSTIEDLKQCQFTKSGFGNVEQYEEWIKQLELFESQKETQLFEFENYKCILSLASLNETGMIWGDLHKLEFYGIESEFLNKNVIKLNSTIP